MKFAHDLLVQARFLVTKEPKKPKQTTLRRAVSTAYYGLFHLLIEEASLRFLTGQDKAARVAFQRMFTHTEMKEAAQGFKDSNPKSIFKNLLVNKTVSADLRLIAQVFVEMQQARHEADYARSKIFSCQSALDFVDQTEIAFKIWSRVRSSSEAGIFLLALMSYQRLSKR
jgi:uncharacterized protein (UPF0332 family)